MLFEQFLLLAAVVIVVFFITIPLYKIIKQIVPVKKDPVKEAKIRLELAQKELEAAKIHKETEKLYTDLYKDVLEDISSEKGNRKL